MHCENVVDGSRESWYKDSVNRGHFRARMSFNKSCTTFRHGRMRGFGLALCAIYGLSPIGGRPAPRGAITAPGRVVVPAAQGHEPARIKKEGVPEKVAPVPR